MPHPINSTPGQTLLIDADDTLWENNVYFERAITDFIAYLDHQHHTPAEIRSVLNRCEHATIATHGYGMSSFGRSLVDCFEEVTCGPATAQQREQIARFAQSIAEHGIELLPGVEATLHTLGTRHRLILVTKGNTAEQQAKIDASGLRACFTAVEIPPEKNAGAYFEIVTRHALDMARTWMIGNSPRSDINPALTAGLHAVYVRHPNTWVLEHEALATPRPPQQLREIDRFDALLEHF